MARPVTVASKERSRQAAELRVAGNTWSAISKEMGYQTESGARQAVRRYYDRVMKESVDTMRPVLHDRGEFLWRQVAKRLANPQNLDEWDRAMRHATSVLTYLGRINGVLDKAPQVQVNINNAPDVRILRQQFLEIVGGTSHEVIDTDDEGDPDE